MATSRSLVRWGGVSVQGYLSRGINREAGPAHPIDALSRIPRYRFRYSDLRQYSGSEVTSTPRLRKMSSSTEPRMVVV